MEVRYSLLVLLHLHICTAKVGRYSKTYAFFGEKISNLAKLETKASDFLLIPRIIHKKNNKRYTISGIFESREKLSKYTLCAWNNTILQSGIGKMIKQIDKMSPKSYFIIHTY